MCFVIVGVSQKICSYLTGIVRTEHIFWIMWTVGGGEKHIFGGCDRSRLWSELYSDKRKRRLLLAAPSILNRA